MHASSSTANSSPFVLQSSKAEPRESCTQCGGFIEEGGMDEHACLIFRYED
ncbi:hypothetical protein IW146_007599 [Coemansia sp. RSA 922]|nr:hypothetical protein GGI08_006749 [Coemansia sp. S2]KAJ2062526.1 hypothetical protein GGI08_002665 [Coemansia sp. S2]KAJ2106832.1 hypothetical protein IW146_007599 [Coemansia sp. RSA 922]KAJ2350318.1 hypothetical protein GGH92_002335 [Coemansia sp. RSA 2673]